VGREGVALSRNGLWYHPLPEFFFETETSVCAFDAIQTNIIKTLKGDILNNKFEDWTELTEV